MTVGFRDEALEDLEEIARYIARDNPAAAGSVIARIHHVIYGALALLPQSGHAAHGAYEFPVPHLPYIPKANAAGCMPDERRPAPQPRLKDSKRAPSALGLLSK